MAVTRIKSDQITDGQVLTAKIASGAVTADKLESDLNYAGDMIITGDLTVNGTTTTINTTNILVEDPLMYLAANTSGTPAADAGFIVERGTSTNVGFFWDESADEFAVVGDTSETGGTAGNVTITAYGDLHAKDITSTSISGSGSGLTSLTTANISSGSLGSGVELYYTANGTSAGFKVSFLDTSGDASGNHGSIFDSGTANFMYNPGTNSLYGLAAVTATTIVGALSGNATTSTTAGTVTTAAQTNITSLGTLTALTITGDLTVDTDTLYVDSAGDNVGIGTLNPNAESTLHIAGTDSLFLPVGTTGQRPSSPSAGMFRYNSTAGGIEVYDGSWTALVGLSSNTITQGNSDVTVSDSGTGSIIVTVDATTIGTWAVGALTMAKPIAMGSNAISGITTATATTFSGDLNGTINTATTGTTQSSSDNSTKVATTAYVDAGLGALSATTITEGNSSVVVTDAGTGDIEFTVDGTSVATALVAGIALKEVPTAPTASSDNNSTQIATTAYVDAGLGALSSTTIQEGNSSIDVDDGAGGAGKLDFTVDAGLQLTMNASTANFQDNAITTTGVVTGSSLAGTVSTATQNSVTTMTGLTTTGTIGTGVWQGTAISNTYLASVAGTVTNGTHSGTNTGDQTTISGNSGTTTKWATARTITLSGDVSGTSSSWDGSGNATLTAVVANDSHTHNMANLSGTTYTAGSGASLTSLTAGNITAGNMNSGVLPYTIVSGAAANYKVPFMNTTGNSNGHYQQYIESGASEFTYNPSTNTLVAGTFSGIATQAKYADLAENYVSDQYYEEGTVLSFGGEQEVTLSGYRHKKVAGVVSSNPAYLMNSAQEGEHVAPLALQGRVPCKVQGIISKGDMLVSAGNGRAMAEYNPAMGMVIGKALEDSTGENVIEVVVGRM